ncbi:uncharacterized protein LOC124279013 [Haliotis rubra]|uniref:uncharacterized protein LOC124279013 n=1 Tax=Haliotis rubra TaxID=36100 RepID=UPI001EE5788B|nr:uncharacterized protein LOC124279013 [Haliotis rubra]
MSDLNTSSVFVCDHCQQTFGLKHNLLRHQRHCGRVDTLYSCPLCQKTFNRKDNLNRHAKSCRQKVTYHYQCSHCFQNDPDYQIHHCVPKRSPAHTCPTCDQSFPTSKALRMHKSQSGHDMIGHGKGRAKKKSKPATVPVAPPDSPPVSNAPPASSRHPSQPKDHSKPCSSQALHGDVREYDFEGQTSTDALEFLVREQSNVISTLESEIGEKKTIKWALCLHIKMEKPSEDTHSNYHEAYFRSSMQIAMEGSDLIEQYLEAINLMLQTLDDYEGVHSGLNVSDIVLLKLTVVKFAPLNGGTYIPLPPALAKHARCILNIQNKDNDLCFVLSILAKLYPPSSNKERETHYLPYLNRLNLEGFSFPMTLKHIPRFEQLNQLSINVYGFEDGTLYPMYISNESNVEENRCVDLLLLSQESQPDDFEGVLGLEDHEEAMDIDKVPNTHYCLITNLNRLVRNRKGNTNMCFVCRKCLWSYSSQERLEAHKHYCFKKAQRVILPKPEEAVYEFGLRSQSKTERAKFLIVADFESLLVTEDDDSSRLNRHVPCGYAYKVVCTNEQYSKPIQIYIGENAAEHFINSILEEYDAIMNLFDSIKPMQLTVQDKIDIATTEHCGLCGKLLGTDRVLDHDHLSGKFRQVLHNKCNLNFQLRKKVIVMFHNLEHYDAHLLLEVAQQFGDREITVIPHTTEQFLSFTVDHTLVFLDSYKFLQSSLDALTQNLLKKGADSFVYLKEQFPQHVDLLTRKLPFPYEHMDSWETLNETCLPSKEAFYSSLTEQGVSEDDYAFAHQLWHTFQCQSMSDFMRLYVTVDVLLLTDVIETFRTGCLADYGLDICHYYSMPGFCLDAAMKITGAKLDLFTDVDTYNFIEHSIRGGVSVIGKKYAESNNEHMDDFDPEKDTSTLLYFDVNSLYATVMLQPLPIGNYHFIEPAEFNTIDWTSIEVGGEYGYILEVDLLYPSHLHQAHAAFPMAPTHDDIPFEELSPTHKQLLAHFNNRPIDKLPKKSSGRKLFCTLKDRSHYVVHFKTLQLYLKHGLVLNRIHRVLKFSQGPWLKSYVELNLRNRKNAKDDCDKDRYKLMNNCVFGRFCMNKRKHKTVRLVTHRPKLQKLTSKTNFKQVKIYSEDVVAVEMEKTSVHLDQPIAVGFSILDLAKYEIYDFYYNVMQKEYGHEHLDLLMTDTDSLFMQVHAPPHKPLLDLYVFMKQNLHLFDTSNYAPNDPKDLYSDQNRKVTGKMKDEAGGNIILEFCGLKSKMYSFLMKTDKELIEKKTAKGIKKTVIKKFLRHKMFKECLFDKTAVSCSFHLIRSFNNVLYTQKQNKVALTSIDNKRYVLEDGIHSVPYGYSSTE